MRYLIPLLVLGFIAPSAIADGFQVERADRAGSCADSVIRPPDRAGFFDESQSCCVFGDPWIAANNMASCCICRIGSGESHDWTRDNR